MRTDNILVNCNYIYRITVIAIKSLDFNLIIIITTLLTVSMLKSNIVEAILLLYCFLFSMNNLELTAESDSDTISINNSIRIFIYLVLFYLFSNNR